MNSQADSSGNGRQQGRNPSRAKVWVLQGDRPIPVTIIEGLQNNQYVEVAQGDLKEGEDVVVGMESQVNRQSPSGQNPFAPRFGGGRGR